MAPLTALRAATQLFVNCCGTELMDESLRQLCELSWLKVYA
jgi:hypothetical protein